MAQAFFPGSVTTPPLSTQESGFSGLSNSEKQFRVEDVQEAYVDQKDR
jgi:hypothetical protein